MLNAKSVGHFALSGDKSLYGLLWPSVAQFLTEDLSPCLHNPDLHNLLHARNICFWLVQESRYFSGFAAMPDRGEGVFFQNRPVGKKKQPVTALQAGAGFKQRCYAHGIRGDS